MVKIRAPNSFKNSPEKNGLVSLVAAKTCGKLSTSSTRILWARHSPMVMVCRGTARVFSRAVHYTTFVACRRFPGEWRDLRGGADWLVAW